MPRQPGSRSKNYTAEPKRTTGPRAVDPFSPWQLMIEYKREEKSLSLRALSPKAEIPAGTLFNWLRSEKGGPNRSQYNVMINHRLAKALDLDPTALAIAYNKSVFPPYNPDGPAPAPDELPPYPLKRGSGLLSDQSHTPPAPGASQVSAPRPVPQTLQEDSSGYKVVDQLDRFLTLAAASGRETFTLEQLHQLAGFVR